MGGAASLPPLPRERLISTDTDNQSRVSEFLDAFHASSKPDFKALTDRYFATDARYQPLVPMRAPAVGREGIRAELERQYEFYSDCKCVIHNIGSGENCVFTERTDTVTLNHDGREVETRLNAVFEMNGEGGIAFWREYYDSGDLVKKLGVTHEEFEKIMAAS